MLPADKALPEQVSAAPASHTLPRKHCHGARPSSDTEGTVPPRHNRDTGTHPAALEAFKVNSIDYLLKPFKEEDLQRALDKFYRLTASERSSAKQRREQMVAAAVADSVQTLLVRYKDKIIPVRSEEVAFFYTSEDRVTLTTLDDRRYPVDKTLEMLSQQLPSDKFYRANRQFIVSREAVKDIVVWFGSRLALNLVVETPERIIISKARVADFKQWLQSIHPA